MKKQIQQVVCILITAVSVLSCGNDDNGTSTTGNTNEYFKYSIDGVERIFDNTVEGHLETQTISNTHVFEINANGIGSSGNTRRIAASFSFDSAAGFLPSTTYNWGLSTNSNPAPAFYFTETTTALTIPPFAISIDFAMNPITATITSAIPSSVGDYMEFTFSGTFDDGSGTIKNINGSCRVQRDADQNF